MQTAKKAERLLVVRLGAMGDILHALPALSSLRCAHPDWEIGWAVEPQWRALLVADSAGPDAAGTAAQPLVDRVHIVPAKRWAREPLRPATLASIVRMRREVRSARYSMALDLQGAVRSAIVARWTGAQRVVGEAMPREPLARHFFSEQIPTHGVHVIEQAAEVTGVLAGDVLETGLPLLPVDEEAQRWCAEQGVDATRDAGLRVLLHPGAGWGAKCWPLERYAEAAALLAQATPVQLLVHAAPADRAMGESLLGLLQGRGVNAALVVPTVGQLIEVTRRVDLVVGGDTGPLHLASALGKPTVGIFGPTDPARNGPFHGRFQILRDPESRRDHTRRREPEAGLLRILPEAVAKACLNLLERAD